MDYSSNNLPIAIDSFSEGFNSIVNETGSPERRLLLGILERAILDYVGNEPKEAREAGVWIFSGSEGGSDDENRDGEKDNVFSFAGICRQLDLDPTTIANIIRQMPKRGNKRIPPWYFK